MGLIFAKDNIEPFAKVVHEVYFSPLSLYPFPPMGAREVVALQYYPAPTGGRMSEGQEGGFEKKKRLLQKALITSLIKLSAGSGKPSVINHELSTQIIHADR